MSRYAAAVVAMLAHVTHGDGIRERVETSGGTAPTGSLPAWRHRTQLRS
ncbi:hypothetical protein WKW79_32925 [Variovorax robiniae]|uniref:Uncharacterized protein n=1 Tax=Variovorax robiniae TaxID=1836199 RepID=A0ABU8XHQ6_9BURK